MEIVIGRDPELIAKARRIRTDVFVLEQKIPSELDQDGKDATSFHVLVTEDASPVGTARLTVLDASPAVLARVCVVPAFRGRGVATRIVEALLSHARKLGISEVEIHAHEHLRSFYETFGFAHIRPVEIVGQHQLIEMRLTLGNTSST